MRLLDKAISNHIANDRQSTNYDSTNETDSLEKIVGIARFNDPLFVTLYNGDFDSTNKLPQISYFTETIESNGIKYRDELYVYIRDNDQVRLDKIGGRIIDILTLPFYPCSTYARITSQDVNIGVLRLERDQDGVLTSPRLSYEKTLKFYTLYNTRRK